MLGNMEIVGRKKLTAPISLATDRQCVLSYTNLHSRSSYLYSRKTLLRQSYLHSISQSSLTQSVLHTVVGEPVVAVMAVVTAVGRQWWRQGQGGWWS